MVWRAIIGLVAVSLVLVAVLEIGLQRTSGSHADCSTPTSTPLVVTDQADYSPGETVHIEGCGFQDYSGQTLPLRVTRPNAAVDSTTVLVDSNGNFTYNYLLDGILGLYYVDVYNPTKTTIIESTTFTDSAVQEFDQCANSQPADIPVPDADPLDCSPEGWINGILNALNSHYAEDESVPQRLLLDLPASGATTGRTVEITYQARKGSVHAYDSLATWNLTQTTANRCQGLTGADCVPGAAMTFAIPDDPTVVNSDVSGCSVNATTGHMIAAGAGRVMTMYGGTITGVSVPVHDDAAAASTDDYATVTITYSVTSLPTKVMLLWGGHISASAGPRGWGSGCGASAISGGPYHMKITGADGSSIGNRDNQIQAGALAPTVTPTATNTATSTVTNTPTRTATNTATNTPTHTATNTATSTRTNTPTNTPTNTATNTATNTPTNTATSTRTNTPTNTATNTATNTPTNTATNTATNTPTRTPTRTNTPLPTVVILQTPTPTRTPGTSLGGVADYPTLPPGGGNDAALIGLIGGAFVVVLGGTLIAGRRRLFR